MLACSIKDALAVARKELAEARTMPVAEPLNAEMLASLDKPAQALTELRRAYASVRAGNPNFRATSVCGPAISATRRSHSKRCVPRSTNRAAR